MVKVLYSCVISVQMVDLYTVELDSLGAVEFLKEGDLVNNGTGVLPMDGEL